MRWSLKELYTSFESEEFLKDLEKLDKLIVEFNNWANENLLSIDNPVEKMEKFIAYSQDLSTLFTRLASFASLTSAVDAKNEVALKNLDRLVIKGSELTKPNVQFQSFIKDLDNLDELINTSELLREHKFYLQEIKREVDICLVKRKKSLFQS